MRVWAGAHEQASISERVTFCRIYGSEVVMPFAVAPACLPAIGICDQREHITIASRVCCSSSTRGGRRAVAGRKRASTTERPLPPHAGVGGSPRTSEHQRARDFLSPPSGVGGSPRTTRSGLVATKRVICGAPLRVWAEAHEQASISERVMFLLL